MSDTDLHKPNDEDSAAEYALHLMAPADRAAFEARMTAEPALASMVDFWHDRLSPLDDDFAPTTPPAALFGKIESRLFEAPARRRMWWPWLAGALVAAALAIAVLQPNLFSPDAPIYTAEMADEDRSIVLSAAVNSQTGVLTVTRVAGVLPEGRDQELWLIVPEVEAPISLGVLPAIVTEITIPETYRASLSQAVLAISDEPLGGSPTGVATGAVLAVGPLALN
ncbi:MAG: anti-sigma factor [Paracoccaceae bacterium]